MNNLPADVLLLIFSLLTQADKLECMTVCRKWEHVIQHNLFQVIYIHREDQLNHLVERVKRDPALGTKVEQMTVASNLGSDYGSNIFFTLFPNVREFAIADSRCIVDKSPFKTGPGHPWCNHITKIVESFSSIYTKTLLHSGLCKNLTDLELKGRGHVRSIIKSLANAPALKTFYLSGYIITFDNLELLHEVTPVLSSLLLNDVQFDVKPLPLDIKPAPSVKSFQYIGNYGFFDFDGPNPHLIYVSKKYTQLEELAIELDVLDDEEGYDPDLLEEQRELLKTYFKSLGLRLKSFLLILDKFNFKYSTGFDFDLLDECGCQIKKLSLANCIDDDKLIQLAKTTQAQYIQSFTVRSFPNYPFSFEWLLRFSVLKELVLDFPSVSFAVSREKWSMGLTEIFGCLNACPLETLRLNFVPLKADDLGELSLYPLLKNLVLFQCKLEKGVDTCISRGFPNLKSLTLDKCFQGIDYFMLLHTQLSHLQIVSKRGHKNSSILVITLGDGERRLYSTSGISDSIPYYRLGVNMTTFDSPSVTSKPFLKSDDTPMLTVVCSSLYDFSMKIEPQSAFW